MQKTCWEIKAYNCPCGKAWFKCGVHANRKGEDAGGDASQQISREKVGGNKDQPNNTTAPMDKEAVRSRKRYRQDLEGTHAETGRRRKVTASEPVFRPSMLSAGLKRKFAHLCQEDTTSV